MLIAINWSIYYLGFFGLMLGCAFFRVILVIIFCLFKGLLCFLRLPLYSFDIYLYHLYCYSFIGFFNVFYLYFISIMRQLLLIISLPLPAIISNFWQVFIVILATYQYFYHYIYS